MKLGEFRKLTEKLSDDTDIIICYHDENGFFELPMMNIRLENKENLVSGEKCSNQVIYADYSLEV